MSTHRRTGASKRSAGRRHHLDRRAEAIIAQGTGDDDELLTTGQVAQWLGMSVQWLEIGRCKGWGPPFVRLGPKLVKYRRGEVREWLKTRTYNSTAEYAVGK